MHKIKSEMAMNTIDYLSVITVNHTTTIIILLCAQLLTIYINKHIYINIRIDSVSFVNS